MHKPAEYLQDILAAYPDQPVLLLWDKAPWHQGPVIQAALEANPRLEVLRFPTASPDLNPQEHVWRATRRAVSHSHTKSRLPDLARRFKHTLFPQRFKVRFSTSMDGHVFVRVLPDFPISQRVRRS